MYCLKMKIGSRESDVPISNWEQEEVEAES